MRKLIPIRFTAALLLAFLGVSHAPADTIPLVFEQTTNAGSVSGFANGASVSATPGPYYWHESNPASGSLFQNPTTTFCVELTQYISTGNMYEYMVTPLASTQGVSSTEAVLISQLWGAHYNTAWNNSSFIGSSDSTAFQLALWELVYDHTNALSLTDGNFKVTSADAAATSTAQAWLNGLSGVSSNSFATNFPDSQLVWLSNSTSQDQVTMIPSPPPSGVPAPPSVVLAGIGVFGILGCSRLTRRNGAR
jgi:hypothetical protein